MTDDEATAVATALAAKDARIAWLETTIATQAQIIGRYQKVVSRLQEESGYGRLRARNVATPYAPRVEFSES